MSDILDFIYFIIDIPVIAWNTVQQYAGAFAIIPVVLILLPLARRLWVKIIKY